MLNIEIQRGPGRPSDEPEQLPGVHPAHARQGISIMTQITWAGIDISKTRLDLATFPATSEASFSNTEKGFAELVAFIAQIGVAGIAVEATGGYEQALVQYLKNTNTSSASSIPSASGTLPAASPGPKTTASTRT